MIRKAIQLYCDNEHGCGDVIFPGDGIFNPENTTAAAVRRAARLQGWRRYQGADYCDGCVDFMKEEMREWRARRKAAV